MPIKAQLPDGTVLEFEDGTPDDVIDRTVKQQLTGGAAPKPSKPSDGAPSGAAPGGITAGATPAAPAGADRAGFEKELGAYYQGLGGKPLDTSVISSLAQKYNVGAPTNLADIEAFYKERGRLNPQLRMTGPEAPPPPTPDPNKIVTTIPKAGDWTQRARAFGKGLLFDFADELEAAGRMVASGELSADEYYRIKDQINADYQTWAKANPDEAMGLELGGGVAGAFVPGLGWAGAGMRGARAAEGIGSVALQGMRAGAISGGLSGFGQAETMAPGDVVPSVLFGTGAGGVTGGVFGKGTELLGRGFAAGRDAVLRRLGRETGDAVERRTAEVLYGSTPSPERAAGATALSEKYGVPTPYGLATPELAALTEKVLAKPSAGQRQLAEQIAEVQSEAVDRVQKQVEDALPGSRDYFDAEDAITKNLRAIGDTEYQKAYQVGSVSDPQIEEVIYNPELADVWKSAQRMARLNKRELSMKMEPVLDEGGNLVGLRPTGDSIPDVEALDYFKRALDDKIEAGYRGNSSVGKGEASALRERRNELVSRLDDLVPEYREARTKYAGDLEVRDALRLGRDILKRTMRPQELKRSLATMSDAEREALRTGARQSIFEPIEDATTARNFAQALRGTRGDNAKMQKLQMVMDPAEFRFFDRALRREDELFRRGSQAIKGARNVSMAQGVATLDDMVAKGNIPEAVDFILAGTPGRVASFARWVSNLNPNKEFGDKVYTKLSQVLAANKPEELRGVLDMLARSKSYGQYMARVKEAAVGPVAGVAGNVAPSVLESNSPALPPTVVTGEEAKAGEDVVNEAKQALVAEIPSEDNAGLSFGEVAEGGATPFSGGSGSVADRNNNPGNLIVSAWTKKLPGYIGPGEGTNEQGIPFAKFDTMDAGRDAKLRLVVNKVNKGHSTPAALVRSWLSPTNAQANPEVFNNYVNYVADRAGLGPNDRISQGNILKVARAIYEFESGNRPK